MSKEIERIEKLSSEYGEEYKKAVDKVIRETGLPEAYQNDLLTKVHGIAFPRAGGRVSAAAKKKRREDVGLGVGEGMEEPTEEGVLKADKDAEVIGDDIPREGVITYKAAHPNGTPLAPKGTAWNEDAEIKKAEGNPKKLFEMHTFNQGAEDVAKGYDFAHHMGSGSQECSNAGVTKCIQKCNGLMKSVQKQNESPDPQYMVDKKVLNGILQHLNQHADEFDPTKEAAPAIAPETAPTPEQAVPVNEKRVPPVTKVPPDQKVTPLSTTVKAADAEEDEENTEKCHDKLNKTVQGKQDAPVADTGGWDGAGASKRLAAWSGGPDKENVNWQKYGKGFLYHDQNNADNFQGYKYPVGDIVNGQFKINRAALAAAAGRINQSSGIPPDELARMKATLRGYYSQTDAEPPENIAKVDVPIHLPESPLVTFVAASPGVIESIRKEAIVGPAGKSFLVHYLKPLGLTRDDVAITYLVPNVLKTEDGKTREPQMGEIEDWAERTNDAITVADTPIVVGLGYTVKSAIGKDLNFTLPHPNSIGRFGAKQELERKLKQINKALVEVKKAHGQEKSLNNLTRKK